MLSIIKNNLDIYNLVIYNKLNISLFYIKKLYKRAKIKSKIY